MGGGGPHEIAGLRAFGDAFGIAFQMKDDLLDIVADERSLGKPVGNDLTERKVTHSAHRGAGARETATSDAEVRRFYDGSANDGDSGDRERRSSARAAWRQRARRSRASPRQAKAALEPIAASAAKEELARLADALLEE